MTIGFQPASVQSFGLASKVKQYLCRKFIFKAMFDRTKVGVGSAEHILECRSGTSKVSIIETFQRQEFELPTGGLALRVEAFLEAGRRAGLKPLIIDAGANAGVTAVYFKLRYPDAVVVAVEPQDDNFAVLNRNTRGLETVHCLQAAVHSSADQGLSVVQPDGLGNDAYRTHAGAGAGGQVVGTIRTCTIDGIVKQHPDCFPFLLKVDVEGHEKEVFSSGLDQINVFPVIFLEPHDWLLPGEGTSAPFVAFAAQFPRDLVISGDKLISIRV